MDQYKFNSDIHDKGTRQSSNIHHATSKFVTSSEVPTIWTIFMISNSFLFHTKDVSLYEII
jgi:hypothetical protein